MRRTVLVAAISMLVVSTAGIGLLVLEGTPVALGFEDTDDPTLMVSFIRQYPHVFAQAGVVEATLAIGLTVACLAVAGGMAPALDALGLRVATAFGLFAAVLFLLGGGVRVGSSGPLLQMARLGEATGEAAYVAAQVATQAAFNGGMLCLSLWIVGLSVMGLRSRTLPLALCVLALVPGFRIVSSLLGPIGLLPEMDLLWVLSMASIFGTFVWCLLLGLVLLRRSFGGATQAAEVVARPAAA